MRNDAFKSPYSIILTNAKCVLLLGKYQKIRIAMHRECLMATYEPVYVQCQTFDIVVFIICSNAI
jgi:hypothetical protein